MKLRYLVLLTMATVLSLTACGQKGALYLPDDKPVATPVVLGEPADDGQF